MYLRHLLFSLMTLVATSVVCTSTADAANVNGQNVAKIRYAQNGVPCGVIFQTGPNHWQEQNRDGRFDFREVRRDQWSVYLIKTGRQAGMTLQIDLYQGSVKANGHVLYQIIAAEPKVAPRPAPINGQTVRHIDYGSNGTVTGRIFQSSPGRWVELNSDGRFDFQEVSRDQWSVYLVKVGRQGGMKLQLDLYQKTVSSNGHVYYKIVNAR